MTYIYGTTAREDALIKEFPPGTKGTANGGFPAVIVRHYAGSMFEVRMPGGVACIGIEDFIKGGMTTEAKAAAFKLIYRHTHKDHKGRIDGERTLMVCRGGSVLVSVDTITDAEVAALLPYAQAKEAARLAAKK